MKNTNPGKMTKYKPRPKKLETYNKVIEFKYEPTYEEREGIISRALIQEQDANKKNNLKWIITEKTMKKAVIKFSRKATKAKKKS